MYEDRTFVRRHPVKVSLNQYERNLLAAAAAYKGMEPAVFVRELVMEEVARALHAADSRSVAKKLRLTEENLGT